MRGGGGGGGDDNMGFMCNPMTLQMKTYIHVLYTA